MNREEIIKRYIKGKNVLDIGCEGRGETSKYSGDLHNFIKKYARKVQGLDLNSENDEIINANAEEFISKKV